MLSTEALAAACRSSCHQGGECSCYSLGPFTARLTKPERKGSQMQLVGIQHGGALTQYRPEQPNHEMLLVVQVRVCCISSMLGCCCWWTRACCAVQCSAVLAFSSPMSARCAGWPKEPAGAHHAQGVTGPES
jgi:hypothetical protein